MADFDHLADLERGAALGALVARRHLAQVVNLRLKIFAQRHVAQMVIVFVGAGDHVAPPHQRLVRQNRHVVHAHRPQRSRFRAEPPLNLFGLGGPEFGVVDDGPEFRHAQLMVAAQHRQHRLAVGHQHQALHLRGFRQARELRHFRDGLPPRCVKLLGLEIALGIGDGGLRRYGRRLLQIGRVSTARAHGHEIFTRLRGHHVLVRLAAAHGARVRLHHRIHQPAALEDAAVGLVMLLVRRVQPGLVHVEGVRILHDELAHPHQPRLGARLVAKLGLDLVPDLRKLLVTAQLAARDRGHHFFVRHAQAQIALEAVLQPEHVVAHDVPAAGLLPQFGRVQRRQENLLGADAVHLLAHDLLDLQQRALRQEQVTVDSRRKLADVSGAQQQFVAGDLGFRRVFAKGRDKQLAPEHKVAKGKTQF